VANNKITIDISVKDDGSMQVVARQAKDTSKALNQATQSSDKLNASLERGKKGHDSWNRQAKGTAQLGMSQGKAFSKQAQSIGGQLVPAYATLAANIFALTAAFGALGRAAALQQLEQGLIAVGSAAGQNLPYVAKGLKEITGAAVSLEQAMSATALAMSAGFSAEKLQVLTKIAKGASLALGRDMGDALTRLVKGAAKLEPEILDELGIMVRLDDAASKYAATLGKSVTQLTNYEKRMAFLNAIADQGTKKFGEMADAVEVNPYDQLASTFNDLNKSIFNFFNYALKPLVSLMSESPTGLLFAMAAFGATIFRTMLPGIAQVIERNSIMAANLAEQSKKASEAMVTNFNIAKSKIAAMTLVPKSMSLDPYKDGSASLQQIEKDLKVVRQSELLRSNWLKTFKDQQIAQEAELAAAERSGDTARQTALNRELTLLKAKIALKQEELTLTQATAVALQEAAVAGGIAAGAGIVDKKTAFQAGQLEKKSAGYTNIHNAGFLGGFVEAGKAAKQQFDGIDKLDTKGQRLGATMKSMGTAVGFFGSALLKALPIIGLVVMAISLIGPLWERFFPEDKVKKKTEELIESFDSLEKTAADLYVKINRKGIPAHEAYVLTITAEIGAMRQLIDATNELARTKAEGIYKKRTEALRELWEVERKIAAGEYDKGWASKWGIFIKLVDEGVEALAKKQAAVAATRNKDIALTFDEVSALVSEAQAKMEILQDASGNKGSQIFKTALSELEYLRKSGILTQSVLEERITAIMHPLENAKSALADSSDAISGWNKELTKLSTKDTTIFDDLDRSMDLVVANMHATFIENGQSLDAWISQNQAAVERIKEIYERMGGWLPNEDSFLFGPMLMNAADRVSEGTKKTIADLQKNAGDRNQLLVAQKNINALAQENRDIMEASLAIQDKVLANAIHKLKIEDDERWSKDGVRLNEEKIVALQDEQNILITTRTTQLNIAEVKQSQRLLEITTKTLAANKSIMEAKQQIFRNTMAISAASSNSDLNPQAEAAIWKAQYAEKMTFIGLEWEAKKKALDLEYKLLQLQLDLEQAKLDIALAKDHLAPDAYDRIKNSINDLRTATAESAVAAGVANDYAAMMAQSEMRATSAVKERARINDIERQKDARSKVVTDTLRAAPGREEAALGVENTRLAERAKSLETELARANTNMVLDFADSVLTPSKDTMAAAEASAQIYLDKLIEIDENGVQRLTNSIAIFAEQASEMQRLGGDIVGSFGEAIAGVLSQNVAGAFAGTFAEAMKAAHLSMMPLIESLRDISPEGALMASISEAAFSIGEIWSNLGEQFQSIGDKIGEGFSATQANMEKAGVVLAAIATTMAQIGQIQAAQSAANIAGMEKEIEAEKKRDGQSAASKAKILALEAKMESAKKKAFEKEKKLRMATTIMSTASAVMMALAQGGIYAIPIAAVIAAMGAMQLAAIAGTSYEGGGSPAGSSAPASVSVGERGTTVDLAKSRSPSGDLAYARGEMGQSEGVNYIPTNQGRAAGGNVGIRVGEQGPEWFQPDRPGRIVPADETEAMGTSSPNVTFNIHTIDSQGMETALKKQEDYIIRMIRKAANARGEFFLEGVD